MKLEEIELLHRNDIILVANKIKVILDISQTNTFDYATDTKMKLNADKVKQLVWTPQIELEEADRRIVKSMLCNERIDQKKTSVVI